MTSYTRTMREAREEMLQAESMSSAQIDKLKKAYEPMRDKRISTANANKLSAMMDRLKTRMCSYSCLKQIFLLLVRVQ
mgnify:CR=1 FL=1